MYCITNSKNTGSDRQSIDNRSYVTKGRSVTEELYNYQYIGVSVLIHVSIRCVAQPPNYLQWRINYHYMTVNTNHSLHPLRNLLQIHLARFIRKTHQ